MILKKDILIDLFNMICNFVMFVEFLLFFFLILIILVLYSKCDFVD